MNVFLEAEGHGGRKMVGKDIVSVLGREERYTVKYGQGPRD